MTQEELKATLLLFGFKHIRKKKSTAGILLGYVIRGKAFFVRFNTKPNKVGITYLEAGNRNGKRIFNSTPESILNFIRGKLT